MHKLNDLPDRVYDVFKNHVSPKEEDLQACLDDIKFCIKRQIEDVYETKQNLRLSQIGKEDRKIYYDTRADVEAAEVDGATKFKFLYGDIIEAILLLLIKTAGYEVTDEQKEVTVDGVKGHMDCKIDGVVSDIKSASPYGFKKFVDGSILSGNDPFGYVSQISAYADAEGEDEAAFIALNKVDGSLAVTHLDDLDLINSNDRVKYLKDMVSATDAPARCYEPVAEGSSGNLVLPKECSMYCNYRDKCWSDTPLRKFQYSNEVKYFTRVVKQPRVQEIT